MQQLLDMAWADCCAGSCRRPCHESVGVPGGQPAPSSYLLWPGRYKGRTNSQVASVARVTVNKGNTEEYVAAFTPLLEQAHKESGTLLYALHRTKDDPHVFWTTEIYADDAAFAAHGASEVHAAASPVFTELIAGADVIIGEMLMAKGLDDRSGSCARLAATTSGT